MAESAGFHVERMIPELEQIRRLNLFSSEEVTEIIKRRKDFEHKIQRSKKEKQDYLSYINTEVKFLRMIKLRRDKFRVFEKKDEIEYAVTKRVTKLYKMALAYFKSDVKLWMSYINFCTQTRFVNAVSDAFKQMLQVHGDKIHLWKYAAKWELEEMNNMDGALKVLQDGIRAHPDSKELYTEAFKLELESASQENKTDESLTEVSVSRADVMFKTSVKAIGDDVEYIISLLDIATKFDFTNVLQKNIVEYLIKNCWKSELMWHTMALRELQGFHYDENKEKKSRINLCITVYKSAIQVVPTSLMWEKYLDTLTDLYRDKNKKKNVKDLLLQTLQEAYNGKFLQEKHFIIWVEIEEDTQKQLEILIKATTALPNSVNLWISRLQLHINLDQEEQLRSVSKEAITTLKEKALPIYKLLIQYTSLKMNSFSEMKALFEEGIMKEPEISSEMKPMYLEWLYLVKNLKIVRQEYEKIAHYTPYCLELHRTMLKLELGRLSTVCVNTMRNIHKLICQQFGKDRTDVWIDYVKFEMENSPKLVPEIYNNAKNTLNDSLVSTFIAEFSLLNTCAD